MNADDSTFEYDSDSQDDEPLEYDSDEQMQNNDDDAEEANVGLEKSQKPDEDEVFEKESQWVFHVHGPPVNPLDQQFDSKFLPLSRGWIKEERPKDGSYRISNKYLDYEHIAGQHCGMVQGGYKGQLIAASEMEHVQFIVRKGPDWKPQTDDMEFELDAAYHLTGLAPHMRNSGSDNIVSPVRHGVRCLNTAEDDSVEKEIVSKKIL
jgi:hypothetical protein